MSSVKVKNDEKTINLPTKNNKIKLKGIRAYLSNADGICYKNERGEICGLEIDKNDAFELVPGVEEYEVVYPSTAKGDFLNNIHRKRQLDMIAMLNGEDPPFKMPNLDPKVVTNFQIF